MKTFQFRSGETMCMLNIGDKVKLSSGEWEVKDIFINYLMDLDLNYFVVWINIQKDPNSVVECVPVEELIKRLKTAN